MQDDVICTSTFKSTLKCNTISDPGMHARFSNTITNILVFIFHILIITSIDIFCSFQRIPYPYFVLLI